MMVTNEAGLREEGGGARVLGVMAKYAQLDELILAHIRNGRDTFGSLTHGETGAMAERFVTGWGSGDRVIDRRLQSLRKRGLIRFGGGRWHLLDACDDGDEADADLLATLDRARKAEARAERLEEALRELVELGHPRDPAIIAAKEALSEQEASQ